MKRWVRFTLVCLIMAGIAVVVAMMWPTSKQPMMESANRPPAGGPTAAPTPTMVPRLKFGVMADIHDDWTDLGKFLATAKARNEQFVVIDGDLTIDGKKAELLEAKKVLDNSGIQYFAVPGNHDFYASTKQRDLFAEVFGEDYLTVEKSGVKLILVNNGSFYGLGEAQTAWLEGEVRECGLVRCIALMHKPLLNNFSKHVMGENNKAVTAEGQAIIKLFNDNNVREVISGHLHYSSAYDLGGLTTTIVGAVSKDRNTQTPRYTEFTVSGGGLEREVVE